MQLENDVDGNEPLTNLHFEGVLHVYCYFFWLFYASKLAMHINTQLFFEKETPFRRKKTRKNIYVLFSAYSSI